MMNINRRQLLIGLSAAALPQPILAAALPQPILAAESSVILRPTRVGLSVNGRMIEMLGFNNSVPGPEIRLPQNDTLSARLENTLEEGTMIHWHGIRLPNTV